MRYKRIRSAAFLLWMTALLLCLVMPAALPVLAQDTSEESESLPVPEAPVPEFPKGECSSGPVGFYWKPSANAKYYEIQWKNDRGEQGTLQRKAEDWSCASGCCILYTELTAAGSYTWTASAVNDSGSAASEETAFTVRAVLSAPEAYRPNRTLSSQNKLTFEWQDTREGASLFRVQAADRSTGRILVDRWFPVQGMFVGNGVCSQSTDLYLPTGAYRWRVQSSSGTSVSAWSGWTDFEVECSACVAGGYTNSVSALLYPIGLTIDLSPYFEWRAVTGIAYYVLKISSADGGEMLNVQVPVENCTLETCAFKPDLFLPAGGEFTWSVSAYGGNNGLWGYAEDTFSTTVPGSVNEVSFVGPQEGGKLDPENPEIVWSDPGPETASFSLAVTDRNGETLFLGDLSRGEAWCDGVTCSIQFRTIPEGEGFRIALTPYSEYNTAGTTIAMSFNN